MCDLFSWIELDAASSKKHHGRKVLFLTDYEVKILRGRGERKWDDNDVVGHTAIEAYYKDIGGHHEESRDKIPPVMAECIKAGRMDGMIAGILGKDKSKWPKYRKDGTRIKHQLEGCEDNKEWVLKSIVYYCANYLKNGRDMTALTEEAIKTYLAGRGGNVCHALPWCDTLQKEEFWSALYYLSTGKDIGWGEIRAEPWTLEEKAEIAKMPKVER